MALLNKKISTLVPRQFPGFFLEERPDIVEFAKKYYEFLESARLEFNIVSYNELHFLQENGDILLSEDNDNIILESKRNISQYNIPIDHYDQGEIITGETSKAQFLVQSRERIIDLGNGYYINASGNTELLKEHEEDHDVVYGYFLTDNYFIAGENLIGSINRTLSEFKGITQNPLNVSRDIENLFDINFTSDTFIEKFYNEISPYINPNSNVDKSLLLNYISDLYISKGNEDSFTFLFRLLFPESTVSFYYPKVDILRVSDGKWTIETVIRIDVRSSENYELFEGLTLTGEKSGSTAFVKGIKTIQSTSFSDFAELILTDVLGTFNFNENVYAYNVDLDLYARAKVTGLVSSANVVLGGNNYEIGDLIEFNGGGGIGATGQVRALEDGVVKTIKILDPGDGYQIGDTILFNNFDTGGSGAEAIVSDIVPTFNFKSTLQKINDVFFKKINSSDFGSSLSTHNANTHLLSTPDNTLYLTFDPAVSGTLFKPGDKFEIDNQPQSYGTVILGDGSVTSNTGANTLIVALGQGVEKPNITTGSTIIGFDIYTGRTSSEIDNAVSLVETGATGDLYAVEYVNSYSINFNSYGALDYNEVSIGGILSVDVLIGGTNYISAPEVVVKNDVVSEYFNDVDSVGRNTKIIKLTSNSGISFTPKNIVKGSIALNISGTGDIFDSLEYIRGLTSDALGIYVKSLDLPSGFEINGPDDIFLVTQIPSSFLSLQEGSSGTNNFQYNEIITGRTSGAKCKFIYNVSDTGIDGEAPNYSNYEIRVLTISGIFSQNEEIVGETSGTSALILNSEDYFYGPINPSFVSAETIKGIDTDVSRTVITEVTPGGAVYWDAPEGLIVGPILDTANSTFSEIRILENDNFTPFTNDHYIVEYTDNGEPLLNSTKGQLRNTNSTVTETKFKGSINISRIEVSELTAGAIKAVDVITPGQSYSGTPSVAITSENGSGAVIEPVLSTIITYPGQYSDQTSLIDSTSKIQDSYYYQQFSYVIRTDVDIVSSIEYNNVIKKLLHPAGLAVFGEIYISLKTRAIIKNISTQYDVLYNLTKIEIRDLNKIFTSEIKPIIASNDFVPFNLTVKTYDNYNSNYLLPNIILPDTAPILEDINLVFEDNIESSSYILLEDSNIITNRILGEQKISVSDVTINVGPEVSEDFTRFIKPVIETDLLLIQDIFNIESVDGYIRSINVHSYGKSTEIDNFFHVDIEKADNFIPINNKIIVNPELKFDWRGTFGSWPASDGPIKILELSPIQRINSQTISATMIQENFDYHYLITENGENFHTEPYEYDFILTEQYDNILFESGERITNEVPSFITEEIYSFYTTRKYFIEERARTYKVFNESYDLTTEIDQTFNEIYTLVTDNLFDILYESVTMFVGLQLYRGRKTPDIFENLQLDDYQKNIYHTTYDELTGTVSIINNNKTVIGTDTLFTSELNVGDYIVTKQTENSEPQKFIVSNIVNDTELELNIEFSGTYDVNLYKEVQL